MRWSQQALTHCVLCFRRDQTFLARRTGQRQRGSCQCNAARQILRAQTHHVNALES